jgi:methyl-accepting chemotaxis protein
VSSLASTLAAVRTVEAGRAKAQDTVGRAAHAGESLDAIAGSISTINGMATQIATAAEEQTMVAEDINQRVSRIRDVASQTAAGTQQQLEAARGLQSVAHRLGEAAAGFKV